jgi:DNA topoisomerase IB
MLSIPPAWEEVWICPDPLGHLQATGSDAAGRKQYLYHERWREQRDREKFRHMIRFAERLPRLRRRVASDLDSGGLTRDRVLAGAIRLLDVGLFRIGGEEYAENGGGVGLATLQRRHVKLNAGSIVFDYPAKGGARRIHATDDPLCGELVRALKRRRDRQPELLAYRNANKWVSVRSEEINDYLKQHAGEEFSAKDFRTWNATVLAAFTLACTGSDASTKTARRRAIDGAVRDVAEVLGNTPAVARRAYIDPRVFDRYLAGQTAAVGGIGGDLDDADERTRARLDRAILELLD